jgi:hypothetical protein
LLPLVAGGGALFWAAQNAVVMNRHRTARETARPNTGTVEICFIRLLSSKTRLGGLFAKWAMRQSFAYLI